jgi:spore maturation protein CgeB
VRFLILNTDYPGFLAWLYNQNPGLAQKSYDEQMHVRTESLFGVANFYSSNLRRLGHEAWDIYINNEFIQRRWAHEHGLQIDESRLASTLSKTVVKNAASVAANTSLLRYLKPILKPFSRSLNGSMARVSEILAAQIEHYQPDVVLNQAMDGSIGHFLKAMKPHVKLLIGQIASPLPEGDDFACYDLIISSLPNFVEYFRRVGVSAELHLFGFEPGILNKIDCEEKSIPVSFVGGVSRDHPSRARWLEYLCRTIEIEVWGYGGEALPKGSFIRKRYSGTAWGIEMYRILRRSKITLNHHIGVAGCYANNMRLFEAAGVGSLLLTDWKVNLNDILAIGKEVLAYRSPEECAATITYYLENEGERESIARAGQTRVLREHTYATRMQELVEIVGKYS